MNFIQYRITHLGLFLLYVLVLWPLAKLITSLDQPGANHVLLFAIRTLGILWIVVAAWMSHQSAKKMTFENMTLQKATITSLYDVRLYLAFLPVIGRFFEPRDKDKESRDKRDI